LDSLFDRLRSVMAAPISSRRKLKSHCEGHKGRYRTVQGSVMFFCAKKEADNARRRVERRGDETFRAAAFVVLARVRFAARLD
jgi:hypothetical protein